MNEYSLKRYERQTILEEIGEEGQKKINNTKVLIVGMGGLGSTVSVFLVRMGIGTLGIVDDDNISITNLQRQILYNETDLGKNKIDCALNRLKDINNELKLFAIKEKINNENIENIIKNYDLVVDCTDNFTTRGIINRACVRNKKTCVFAAVSNFEGFLTVISNGKSPCYECLIGEIDKLKKVDESNLTVGVLGAVVGIIASMQAVEIIKIILNIGTIPIGKLMVFNSLDSTIRTVDYIRREDCFCNNEQIRIC